MGRLVRVEAVVVFDGMCWCCCRLLHHCGCAAAPRPALGLLMQESTHCVNANAHCLQTTGPIAEDIPSSEWICGRTSTLVL